MQIKGEIKTFLTHDQIREINNDVKVLTNMLNGVGNSGGVGNFEHTAKYLDEDEVRGEIYRKKKMLHDGVPVKLKGAAANKAYSNVKKLEKWISDYMPSKKDISLMYPKGVGTPHKETTFNQAVEKEMKWMQHGTKMVDAYRYLRRKLDPENQDADNIEHLRRN